MLAGGGRAHTPNCAPTNTTTHQGTARSSEAITYTCLILEYNRSEVWSGRTWTTISQGAGGRQWGARVTFCMGNQGTLVTLYPTSCQLFFHGEYGCVVRVTFALERVHVVLFIRCSSWVSCLPRPQLVAWKRRLVGPLGGRLTSLPVETRPDSEKRAWPSCGCVRAPCAQRVNVRVCVYVSLPVLQSVMFHNA